MARGDFTIFQDFALTLGSGVFDFDNDTLKLGLVTNGVTPSETDVHPSWADYSGSEVSAAGGYTSGGETIPVTWTETGGVGTLQDDGGDISLAQNGSGFTNAYYGILYDDTEGSDAAIGFIDLNGPVSEQDGPVNINWHATAILQVTVT
jgi:hypothetical protein